jgi:hypothetical protein
MKALIIIFFSGLLLFLPIFLSHQIPFPGNYLISWFEPWKTTTMIGNALGVAHKAVADDVFRQIYPFKKLAVEMIANHQWPLWNPYNGAGQPLLATMQPGFLNPLSIFLLNSFGLKGWSIYILIQPLLLGIAVYLYCRSLKVSPIGSFVSAVILIFSGFSVARYVFGDYVYGLICIPFLLFLFETYKRTRNNWYLLSVPIVVALMVLSTHPQIDLYVIIFCCIYFWVFKYSIKNVLLFYGLIIWGLLISSIQLLPTFELYRLANINSQSSNFIMDRFLMPLSHLITIIFPNYFGNQGTYNWWGSGDYVETIASVGTIPVFLGLFALITRNKKSYPVVSFYHSVFWVTLLLSLNWFGARLIFHLPIPILSTGIPTRIYLITAFAIAVLSGFGFDQIKFTKFNRFIRSGIIYALFLLGLWGLSYLLYLIKLACPVAQIPNCRMIALRNTGIEIFVYGIFFGLLLIYQRIFNLKLTKNTKVFNKLISNWIYIHRIKFYRLSIVGILGLIITIGWYNSIKFLPFSPESSIYPKSDIITRLKSFTGLNRNMGLGSAGIATDLSTELRLYDPNYYDPLYIKSYGELVSYGNTGNSKSGLTRSDVNINNEILPKPEINTRRNRLFDVLGVKYLLYKKNEFPDVDKNTQNMVWQDNTWVISERQTALERAYLVHQVEIIPDSNKQLARLFTPDFDPVHSVILGEDPLLDNQNALAVGNDSVGSTGYFPFKINLAVSTSRNGMLILSDNFYPGWEAQVDGKQSQILRANYTLRAVRIPAGIHNVTFVYNPGYFNWGKSISICFGLILLLIIITKLILSFLKR